MSRNSYFVLGNTVGKAVKCKVVLTSIFRQRISIYLDPLGRGIPCAKLFSNVLGTNHKLIKCPDSLFPAAVMKPHLNSIIPISDVLTSIQYKLRMKGMMQPRKLNVVLPMPDDNLEANYQARSEIRIKRNGSRSTNSLMDAINRRQSEPAFKAKSETHFSCDVTSGVQVSFKEQVRIGFRPFLK